MKTIEIQEKVQPHMMTAGLDEQTIIKEVGFAAQAIQENATLQKCSKPSLFKAVINVAYVGLSLNPLLKEAYLTPRWNRSTNGFDAVLMPSYIGLKKLAMSTGGISHIICNAVYSNEAFKINLASPNPIEVHVPVNRNKGELIGAYAISVYENGKQQVEYMNADDIEYIRSCSDSWKAFKDGKVKSCVWDKWPGEMARKSVLKRLVKYLPRHNQKATDSLEKAIEIDNTEYGITFRQQSYIESLIQTTTLDDDRVGQIEGAMFDMSFAEATEAIKTLKEHQMPLEYRDNLSATEVNKVVADKLNAEA